MMTRGIELLDCVVVEGRKVPSMNVETLAQLNSAIVQFCVTWPLRQWRHMKTT